MLFFIEHKSSWIDIFASFLRKALIILFPSFYRKKKKELIKKKRKKTKFSFLIRQGRIVEIVTLHSLLGTLLAITNQSSQPGHLLLRIF